MGIYNFIHTCGTKIASEQNMMTKFQLKWTDSLINSLLTCEKMAMSIIYLSECWVIY